jgi:hypothetical protein
MGAFAIEKDASEDSTVVYIIGDRLSNRVRRTSDSIDMIVLKMLGE